MPIYEVEAPDGRVFEVEGSRPPTSADLGRIYGTMGRAPRAPRQPSAYAASMQPLSSRDSMGGGGDDFDAWYSDRSSKLGLDPNPDAPEHFYDYRAAHAAGAEPDESGHWPSKFKKEGHPRMVVDGVNTKTGERVDEEEPVEPPAEPAAPPAEPMDLEAAALEAIPQQLDENGQEDIRVTRQREELVRQWQTQMQNPEDAARPDAINPTPWFRKTPGHLFGSPAGPSTLDVIRAAPDIGGGVGALIGGSGGAAFGLGFGGLPGATGGAVLGGSGGEAVKELALHAIGARPGAGDLPTTSGDAAMQVGVEGLKQGAYELGGRALAGGVRKLGKGAYERALAPGKDILEEFPEVVEDSIKERVPVSRSYLPGAKKGSEIAAEKLNTASRDVDALLDDAAAKGQVYTLSVKHASKVDQALSYVKNVSGESDAVKKLLARPTSKGISFIKSETSQPILDLINQIHYDDAQFPGKFDQMERWLNNFLKSKVGPLTPKDMQAIQQRGYKIAKQIYDARNAGASLGPRATVRAQANEAIAKGIKRGVMDKIPGVAEGQARKQALIGVEKAVGDAELRPQAMSLAKDALPAAVGALFGAVQSGHDADRVKNTVLTGALTWGLARGLIHPRQLSRVGLMLTAKQTQALVKQFPRLLDMVVTVAAGRSRDEADDAAKSPNAYSGRASDDFWGDEAQSTLR